MMELPEALPEELEEVRNLLTPEGLCHIFDGGNYDRWELKVRILLRSQYLWNLLVEEDPIDPETFNALRKFKK